MRKQELVDAKFKALWPQLLQEQANLMARDGEFDRRLNDWQGEYSSTGRTLWQHLYFAGSDEPDAIVLLSSGTMPLQALLWSALKDLTIAQLKTVTRASQVLTKYTTWPLYQRARELAEDRKTVDKANQLLSKARELEQQAQKLRQEANSLLGVRN